MAKSKIKMLPLDSDAWKLPFDFFKLSFMLMFLLVTKRDY